jgi:AcrR family transcriptional regulator
MEKFWEGGYEATSLVDLTECMGVQKASLYATYGDKRKLFITALAQYQDTNFAAFVTGLEQATSVREYLREGLMHWMREAATRDSARGCSLRQHGGRARTARSRDREDARRALAARRRGAGDGDHARAERRAKCAPTWTHTSRRVSSTSTSTA